MAQAQNEPSGQGLVSWAQSPAPRRPVDYGLSPQQGRAWAASAENTTARPAVETLSTMARTHISFLITGSPSFDDSAPLLSVEPGDTTGIWARPPASRSSGEQVQQQFRIAAVRPEGFPSAEQDIAQPIATVDTMRARLRRRPPCRVRMWGPAIARPFSRRESRYIGNLRLASAATSRALTGREMMARGSYRRRAPHRCDPNLEIYNRLRAAPKAATTHATLRRCSSWASLGGGSPGARAYSRRPIACRRGIAPDDLP